MQQPLSTSGRIAIGGTLAFAIAACSVDRPAAPVTPPAFVGRPNANVLPASAYTLYTPIQGGRFTDVNDSNLIVGYAYAGYSGNRAVVMSLAKSWYWLSQGTATHSSAEAVNQAGQIVGQAGNNPAYWPSRLSDPVRLNDAGIALDVNDNGLIVGYFEPAANARQAFVWDSQSGSVQLLPPPKGYAVTQAIAVNNDNAILGWSWVAGDPSFPHYPTKTVLWRRARSNSPWVPRAVSGMIGYDIGANEQTVGQEAWAGRPAFGTPDYAGLICPYCDEGWALALSTTGLAAGWEKDAGYTPTPFVADLVGGYTELPNTAGSAHGVNACGLVVGEVRSWPAPNYVAAAIWDPGC